MNIAIVGYGKMGKELEKVALSRNHAISFKINSSNSSLYKNINSNNTDIILEFTTPSTAYDNIMEGLKKKIPVISGSTGWLENMGKIQKYCEKEKCSFLHASNFSIGMNIFFLTNKYLAKLLTHNNNYKVSISETHHKYKKDNPSGTSLKIKKDLNKVFNKDNIKIHSYRKNEVIGDHSVEYNSIYDDIFIKHIAKSRQGFALGAILCAEFLRNKIGFFKIEDVIFQKYT